MTTSNQSGAADCGVEVVGRGEGVTVADLYDALPDVNPFGSLRGFSDPWKRILDKLVESAGHSDLVEECDARTNIRLTNRPLTAAGLRLIAERLEV